MPRGVRRGVTVRTETLFVDDGSRRGDEVRTAVIQLDFAYGAARLRADDLRASVAGGARDRAAELGARRVLEGLGAVELSCLDDCAVAPGAQVDYVVGLGADVHALCAFSAYALAAAARVGLARRHRSRVSVASRRQRRADVRVRRAGRARW